MNRTGFAAGIGSSIVLAVLATSASATVIGTSTQGSTQGVNATQQANASTATGNIIFLAPAVSANAGTQDLTTDMENAQSVGTASGGNTFISPTGAGPSQDSRQGANTLQGSANGAIGQQKDENALQNSQIVGGDQTCVPPGGPCAASTIIGSPSQGNGQGVNAAQIADGGVTTGNIIVAGGFTFNAPAGTIAQILGNTTLNGQIILG